MEAVEVMQSLDDLFDDNDDDDLMAASRNVDKDLEEQKSSLNNINTDNEDSNDDFINKVQKKKRSLPDFGDDDNSMGKKSMNRQIEIDLKLLKHKRNFK